MANVAYYSPTGEKKGNVDLPADLLADQVYDHAVWETVKGYLANQRQGTHKTKTRHEVSGQKSKLYKQKGTGRARAGSATSGVRVGGGRIHGPRPRDYSYRVPIQVRRLALQSALAARAASESLVVVDDFQLDAPRTKTIAEMIRNMGFGGRKVLVVSRAADTNLLLSCRNLPKTQVSHAGQLNAYEVLHSEAVVLTRGGLDALTEVLIG